METPPFELRRRLQRSHETNRFLEAELAELREFTKLESQFMLLEEGCSKLSDERCKLAAEVERLTKSHEEFKCTFSGKFLEKKNYLVDLVDKGVKADITKEIALAFDDLANLLDVKCPSKNAAPSRTAASPKESLIDSKTLDMMQNELSKIKLTFKGPRRLSDSSLVVERFRKPKTNTRDALSQTEANSLDIPVTDPPNLLDLSISTLQGAADTPELPTPTSEVSELELKLAAMREECRKLTVANYNLKLTIDDKSDEIQELMDLMDETRASCTCKPMGHGTEDIFNSSDVNESRRNQSSYLPTILEISFDGSEMNDSSFAPEPNSICGPIESVEERESHAMTDLEKCNNFLSSELNYCLSEVEAKNEQITMLHSIASSAISSELSETLNQELEGLEILFTDDKDVFSNDEIKLDVVKRLENALSLIQKYIDSYLSSPKFEFSPELINNSSMMIDDSAVNETLGVLADNASFPQQLCNAVFNASSNTSTLDTSTFHNTENVKLSKIMNDVRNLRNCSFTVISSFSRKIFEVVNKLARMESILLQLRNNSPADGANCFFYKSILLKDIKENADLFLGHDNSSEDSAMNHSNPLRTSYHYDPECTQLLSMDVSSLNANSPAKRILHTSQTVNQHEKGEDNKENVLKNTVKNYIKLIADSNSRIRELEVAKNNAEMKLSQKMADYCSLANQQAQSSADLLRATENITTLEDRVKSDALEKDQLVHEVQQTSEELSKVIQRNSELESNLKLVCSEKEAIENDLIRTSEELKNASERVIEFELKANADASEKGAINVEVNCISEKLAAANARITELEETIAADAVIKEALRVDLENISEELLMNKGEKLSVENRLIRLSEEMSEVTQRVSALRQSLSSLESEKQLIENELTKAYETLSAAEKKVFDLETNLAACNTNSAEDDLKNKLYHISDELSRATEHNSELERELIARNEQNISFSTKLEKEISVLQELIKKTRHEFCDLIKFSSERLDFLMISNRDLQVMLCEETTKNCNAISELQDKLTFAEAEIAELESGLCHANAQVIMKQNQIEELEAGMSSKDELLKRLQDLEILSSDLSSSLELTKFNMKELIKTSSQRINILETSCKAAEVELVIALAEKQNLETKLAETSNKLYIETMDREKLTSELSDSMIVLHTLREAMQKNEETLSLNNYALAERTAENELLKYQLNNTNMNLMSIQKNFEKLILDSNQLIDKHQLSKRQLSMIAAEESNAKNKLIQELRSSEALIKQLKDFIEHTESCKPRGSLKGDGSTAPCTPLSRSTRSGSVLDDRSGFSCASLGVEEEDMSYSHATVNFERSVFVSDLPMERTMCVDNIDATFMSQGAIDPLSLTIMPEKCTTPRHNMLSDDESSGESNFGTPVASRWGHEKSPNVPNELQQVVLLSAAKDQIKTISNDIASLKLELKTLFSQRLPSEVTETLNKISSMYGSFHDELSREKSRITELDDTNAKLRETILTGSLEKESLRDELRKEHDVVEVLQSRLKDLEMDNYVLLEERDVSQMQVQSLEKVIEEAVRSWYQDELPVLEDVTQELKSLVREVSNAKNLISDYLKKPNINFFSEVKSLLSKNEMLDKSLAILKTEGLKKCKDLKDECNQIIRDTASLHAEIQKNIQNMIVAMVNSPLLDPKTDDLEVQLKTHKCQIVTLEAKLNEKIKLIETLQSQLECQTNDNNSLSAINSKLLQDIQNAKVDNDDIHLKFEELQTANTVLAAQESRLQETINSMTEQLASNEKSMLHSSNELDKCRERITDLEKELGQKCEYYNEEKLKVTNFFSNENAKLSEELIELKTRQKDLSAQMEDLIATNNSLSEKIASLLVTNTELEDKLSSTESELTDAQKKIKELTSASSCAGKSSLEIETMLSSLVESTAGQPVDLTCNVDSPLDILVHMKKVMCKTNDALNAVFSLLNTKEISGIDALESLYIQLKDSNIEDVYMCKKKFATEISSLEPEIRVEDLVKLTLIELQAKLVSVIMEKEQVLIQNYQAECDKKVASKQHTISQYEDREKYMREMIEDLTNENEKLENIVSELKSGKSMKGEQDVLSEYSVLNSEQIKSLKDNIETLKEHNLLLEFSLKEAAPQKEKLSNQFAQILTNLQILLEDDAQNEKSLTPVDQIDINSDLKQVLDNIHLKISIMRSKATEDQLALIELDKHYKELENEHNACKYSVSALQTKCVELSNEVDSKIQQIAAICAEKAQFKTEVDELRAKLTLKGGEGAATEEATIADLNAQLEMSAKYIEELESHESNIEKIRNELLQKVGDLSKECKCLKKIFSQFLCDVKADVSEAMLYIDTIAHRASDLDNRQVEHSTENNVQLDSLNVKCNDLCQEKQMLLESLMRETNGKIMLQDKVKVLEDLLAKPVHHDETCPFKAFKDLCEVSNNEKQELQKSLAAESNSVKRLSEKVRSLEEKVSTPIHLDENCPYKAFGAEREKLEITLLKAIEEKDSLLKKLAVLEGKSSEPVHDNRSCPYKEKIQEYKRDLWITRSKAEEEKKNFDIMKKNLQEDLAFKSSTIKELEDRNEATINDFKQRLASSTVSYNQLTQKLEEANERITFLRDMNSQDKKRFEKEIDVLSKEISRLHVVSVFLQSIEVENDKIQEALPVIKKKLSDYDNLKTELASAVEKNAELDKECDDMCAEIKLLQSVVGEKCEENDKLKKANEKLKKEVIDMNDLQEKYKSLQNELNAKILCEVQLAAEFNLKESQLNEISRKLADESLAKSQLENAYKQLESNLERCNQKINQYISQIKNYDMAVAEKNKLIEELECTISEMAKQLKELESALEVEKSKAGAIHGQKLALEELLSTLQKELAACKSCLGTVPELEAKFQKLSLERDEAVKRYQEIQSQLLIVQNKMQDYIQQVSTLKDEQKKLLRNNADAEQNFKAQRLSLCDEINKLKNDISCKNTRIIEMESVMASQNDIVIYQNKISELQDEIGRLKNELAQQTSYFSRPHTAPVVVQPSSSNQQTQRPQMDYEEYHKLEKKYTVLKRLAEMRRSKILSYQNILAQHHIDLPQNEVSS